MAKKGGRQYTNPTREAIAKSTGISGAGSRTAASNRIVNDSMLRNQNVQFRNGATNLLNRMGVPQRGEKDSRGKEKRSTPVRFVRNSSKDRTVTRHNSAVKDPTTGFGINVEQRQKAFKVSFS